MTFCAYLSAAKQMQEAFCKMEVSSETPHLPSLLNKVTETCYLLLIKAVNDYFNVLFLGRVSHQRKMEPLDIQLLELMQTIRLISNRLESISTSVEKSGERATLAYRDLADGRTVLQNIGTNLLRDEFKVERDRILELIGLHRHNTVGLVDTLINLLTGKVVGHVFDDEEGRPEQCMEFGTVLYLSSSNCDAIAHGEVIGSFTEDALENAVRGQQGIGDQYDEPVANIMVCCDRIWVDMHEEFSMKDFLIIC